MGNDREEPEIVEQPKTPAYENNPQAERAEREEIERIRRMKGKKSTRVSGDYGTGGATLKTKLGGS